MEGTAEACSVYPRPRELSALHEDEDAVERRRGAVLLQVCPWLYLLGVIPPPPEPFYSSYKLLIVTLINAVKMYSFVTSNSGFIMTIVFHVTI